MKQQTLPEDPTLLLDRLERDTMSELCERSAPFRRAAELYEAAGQMDKARSCTVRADLFSFYLRSRQERPLDAPRFSPIWRIGDQAYPRVEDFGPEELAYVADALAGSVNPLHLAHYGDFLWEVRHDHQAARVAVEAYQSAAPIHLANGAPHLAADALDRAAELALRLSDQGAVNTVKQQSLIVADQLIAVQTEDSVRWALDALEVVQGCGKAVTADDQRAVLALAERGAEFFRQRGELPLERDFLAILPVVHNKLGNTAEAQQAKRLTAVSFEEEAQAAESATVRIHWLQRAIEAYSQIGDSAKVDELKQALSEAGVASLSEMTILSVEVQVPRGPWKAAAERLLALPLDLALAVLAAQPAFVPRWAQIVEHAARRRERFPLQYMVARQTLDANGRIVGTDDDPVRTSEADVYELDARLRATELCRVLDRLERDRGLDQDALVAHFRQGAFFRSPTLELAAEGVRHYFAGEYVAAVHILVPQVEEVLRTALELLKVSRTSFQQGSTREKPLDVVLQTPELRQLLGEDSSRYLDWIYGNGPRAMNLRNRVAHGLIERSDCTRELVQLVFYCFVLLSRFILTGDPTRPASVTEARSGAPAEPLG